MTLILGIDPGSRITGFGIIETKNNDLSYVSSGCIRTNNEEFNQRLLRIYDGIAQLMREYNPSAVAIEAVFMAKNASAALKLGQARGAAIVAAAQFGVNVHDYSAREVKQSVVGYGAAQKTQVQHMITRLLGLGSCPQSDAADALAVAICHTHMHKNKSLLKMR
jgi:crossover junction endodeoxyribonuclease RuvC